MVLSDWSKTVHSLTMAEVLKALLHHTFETDKCQDRFCCCLKPLIFPHRDWECKWRTVLRCFYSLFTYVIFIASAVQCVSVCPSTWAVHYYIPQKLRSHSPFSLSKVAVDKVDIYWPQWWMNDPKLGTKQCRLRKASWSLTTVSPRGRDTAPRRLHNFVSVI